MRALDYFNAAIATTALLLSVTLAWFEYVDRVDRRPHVLVEHHSAIPTGLRNGQIEYIRRINLTNVGSVPAVINSLKINTDFGSHGYVAQDTFLIKNNLFDSTNKLAEPIIVEPFQSRIVEFRVGTIFDNILREAWEQSKLDLPQSQELKTPESIWRAMVAISKRFNRKSDIESYLRGSTSCVAGSESCQEPQDKMNGLTVQHYSPVPFEHYRIPCDNQKIMLIEQCLSIELTDVTGVSWLARPMAAGYEITYAIVF